MNTNDMIMEIYWVTNGREFGLCAASGRIFQWCRWILATFWTRSVWLELGISETARKISGWWFGTFFIFPYIGNHHPN